MGKGSLKVTVEFDTKKQRLLVRDTMGRVTLNSYFLSIMKFEKGNSSIRFLAPAGENNALVPVMLKLKSGDVQLTY